MTESAPRTIHLADYRPPAYLVDTVDLRVDIHDEHTDVTARAAYRLNPEGDGGPLRLDGIDLELLSASLDDEALAVEDLRPDEEGQLVLDPGRESFVLETTVRIRPAENTSLEGLYVSGGIYCTQMEAQGFRRLTWFQDRPDVLSRYVTTVVADAEKLPVLLANGDLTESGELGEGRHYATWTDPHPKPCYLFALVAGDLARVSGHYTTASGRDVDLHVYVEHGNEDRCDHAIESLKRSMKWDEDTWQREYDLGTYMIVAVNDFNAGAMENKGLNIFNAALVLARPETATDFDFYNIESVIAHEYFHNWSGNRVTLRDWFQLSLKEGLTIYRDQEFSSDVNSRAVKRISDVRGLRTWQFPEDAGPMAHPVRPSSFIKIDNFYTTTVYEKGAEVIRMIATLIGPDAFREGMALYFERHDGQAVTTEHFVAAMEEASGRDLGPFKTWYDQAGTPELHVEGEWDEATHTWTMTVRQSCPPTPGQEEKKPYHIPLAMGLVDETGAEIPLIIGGEPIPGGVIELTEPSHTLRFENVRRRPVPSLLRAFSAPVKLHHDHSERDLAVLLAHDTDSFCRWEAAQQLAERTMLRLVADRAAGAELAVSDVVIDAFGKLLADDSLDPALVAESIEIPGESRLGDLMEEVDVDGIHASRRFFMRTLAAAHEARLVELHETLGGGEYAFDPVSMGRRRLKNNALGWLSHLETDAVGDRCLAQFESADNMTDRFAALAILAHEDGPRRQQALATFEAEWRDDPLVMNKWFGVQAASSLPGTLADVERLSAHAGFDPGNPNNVRALWGTFARNQVRFHEPDGAGYRFLADRLLEIDRKNALLAGRMAGLFNQWKRFDAGRREAMKSELERVLGTEGVSDNVYEVVSRALA